MAVSLSHRSPNFLSVLAGKGHVILRRGTPLEVQVQQASSVMGFSYQVKVDGDFTGPFLVLHFHESHTGLSVGWRRWR